MKFRVRGAVVALVVACAASSAAAWPRYGVVLLDRAADAVSAQALGLNDTGLVVGTESTGGGVDTDRAVVWDVAHGGRRVLGEPGAWALAVNDAGIAVGFGRQAGRSTPVAWLADGSARWFELPSRRQSQPPYAPAINAAGVAVVQAAMAWRWVPETAAQTALPDLPGGGLLPKNFVLAINAVGDAAGGGTVTSAGQARRHAAIFRADGSLVDLGVLPGDATSVATAINDRGDVVGESSGTGAYRSFLWSAAQGLVDLSAQTPCGGDKTLHTPLGITEAGVVLGECLSPEGVGSAGYLLWQAGEPLAFLRDLIDYDGPPADLGTLILFALNESGAIVGSIRTATGSHAVLLVPRADPVRR